MRIEASNEASDESATPGRQVCIETRSMIAALPALVWDALMFYEDIDEPPPLHLRLLLPVPVRIEAREPEVGAEMRCIYESGSLVKRITRLEASRAYEFDVTTQELGVGRGVQLIGGRYTLSPLPNERTEVTVQTRYLSRRWPRWLWSPLEKAVCHSFHRYLLGSIRRRAESEAEPIGARPCRS